MAIMRSQQRTPLIDLNKLERELAEEGPAPSAPVPQDFAPKTPLPSYVEHRDGVSRVGRLSAEAVVREYEEAAKEIEAMSAELTQMQQRVDEEAQRIHDVVQEVRSLAQRYRDEGKRLFERIEECAMMTDEVRTACATLAAKISSSK